MEIRRGPLLTVFEAHRVIAAGLVSKQIHVAQMGDGESRWVGDAAYVQETPRGLLFTNVTADLFIVGSPGIFTPDRRIEASVRSHEPHNPFHVRFSAVETNESLRYLVHGFESPDNSQTFKPPIAVNYSFREPLVIPRQITQADLNGISDTHALLLNQEMTAGILRTARLPLFAPIPTE